jgi:hypothetical protein
MNNGKWKISLFCLLFASAAFAASDPPPPSEAEIKAALERGQAVRSQKALLSEALGTNAFVIKIQNVRCGHGVTKLEDAKGENGATYRLVEESRSAMADDEGGVIVDYKGVYLLNSSLGLISGNLAWKNTVKNLAEKKDQVHEEKCDFKVEKGEFKWTSSVGGQNGSDSTPLNGDPPLPQSILPMLAVFAQKSGAPDKPICVAELSPLNEQQTFDIQPAWLTFERVKDKPTAVKVSVVHLLGDFDKHGMALSPNNRWTAPQVFVLDGAILTQLPAPPAPGLSIEPVAADKLDVNVELDLAKISAAVGSMAQPKNMKE